MQCFCVLNMIRSIRVNNMKAYRRLIYIVFLLFFGCQGNAAETYWLSRIESPEKVLRSEHHPVVEDPRDAGYALPLTIDGGKFYMHGDNCGYDVDFIRPFSIGRALADLIDDVGGRDGFDAFLKKKLNTKMSDWKDRYVLKASVVDAESTACQLLQSSSIFRGDREVILWDTTYFYKFELGKAFKGRNQ